MKIISYRDFKNKDQLFPLMHQALWWPLDYRELEQVIKVDERLSGPVGFCAVEEDQLAGFVGVLDITSKTTLGIQKVGGIWGVATSPSFANRGIFKKLMNRTHEYFKGQGYPLCFLFTSRTLIAYEMYGKLGYEEVEGLKGTPSAYKLCSGGGFDNEESENTLDWEKIYDTYNRSVEGKTGFVIRQDNYKEALEAWKRIEVNKSIQKDSGYALLLEREGAVRIREIIAEDEKAYENLISEIEQRAEGALLDVMVVDEKLEKAYRSHDFLIQRDNYDVLMVKKLAESSFGDLYGDKFQVRALDTF